MKCIRNLLLGITAILATSTGQAYSGYYYTISLGYEYHSDGTATAKFDHEPASPTTKYTEESIIIPSTVSYNGENYTVTEVTGEPDPDEYCDYTDRRNAITSVTLPNTVVRIDDNAFCNIGLRTIDMGENVTYIGNNAFASSSLTEIEIGKNVTHIGNRAFASSSLTEINLGDNVTHIGKSVFNRCLSLRSVKLPSSITAIGEAMFANCNSLESLTLPPNVNELGKMAFAGCKSLKTLVFSDCLTRLDSACLANTALSGKLELPSTLKHLAASAFNGTGVTEINIPAGITSLDSRDAFLCDELTTVVYEAENLTTAAFPKRLQHLTIAENVKTIPEIDSSVTPKTLVYNAINAEFPEKAALKHNFRALTSVTFGPKVNRIPPRLLSTAIITEITIPANVRSIGKDAFSNSLRQVNTPSLEAWLQIEFDEPTSNPTYYAKELRVEGESIRRLVIPDGTEHINNYAFINCEPLVTATLPSSLKSAGDRVFDGCTGLQRIIFPDLTTYLSLEYHSGTTFQHSCSNAEYYIGKEPLDKTVTTVVVPEGVNRLADYAFNEWTNLESVTLPESLHAIGRSSFERCNNLKEISIPAGVVSIGSNAFARSGLRKIELPEGLTELGDGAFYNCASFSGFLWLPQKLTRIGANTFAYTYGISAICFPDKLKTIGDNAFAHARMHTPLILPESVDSLGCDAFSNCVEIPSVTLPDNLAIIGEKAFYQCTALSEVKFGSGTKEIGAEAFSGCSQLNIELPLSIETIGKNAFNNCSALRSVRFGNIKTIGERAFSGCYNLEDIDIYNLAAWCAMNFDNPSAQNPIYQTGSFSVEGEKVRCLDIPENIPFVSSTAFCGAYNIESLVCRSPRIEREAFLSCPNLTKICLSTEEIGAQAFGNITEIYSMTTTPPVADDTSFGTYKNVKLYVPEGSVSAYENAPSCWWRFLDVFEFNAGQLPPGFSNDNAGLTPAETGRRPAFTLSACGGNLTIGCSGTVSVFNANGNLIYHGEGDVTLSPGQGFYIVTDGTDTSKIVL